MSESTPGLIVTAGSDPINLRICEILSDDGFRVVHIRDAEADQVPADPRISSIVQPITDFAGARDLLAHIERSFGPVGGLVTPLLPTTSRTMGEITAMHWANFRQQAIKRNVALARAASVAMSARIGGRIVVLSSSSAFFGVGVEQAAAHAAMISLSNAITLSMDAANVASNCVIVGHVGDAPSTEATTPTSSDMIGSVVSYLLGSHGSEISGQLVACFGTTVGLYVAPLIIESTNVLVRFGEIPKRRQIGEALGPLLNTGRQ